YTMTTSKIAPQVPITNYLTARRTSSSNSPCSTDNYSDSNNLNFVMKVTAITRPVHLTMIGFTCPHGSGLAHSYVLHNSKPPSIRERTERTSGSRSTHRSGTKCRPIGSRDG